MNMLTSLELNRRDWYLNQLGITQYELRQPKALSESATLALTDATRLIIMAEETPLKNIFFQDILSALDLNPQSVLFIKPAQAALLPNHFKGVIWSVDSDRQPELCAQHEAIIETGTFQSLQSSATEKRFLWQKLCEYEDYFRT